METAERALQDPEEPPGLEASDDEDWETEETSSIPIKTCKPCRVEVYTRLNSGEDARLTAYVDPGSAATFISANVADKLGIKAEEVEPTTFGGAVSETISKAGRVRLSPTEDTQPHEVIAFIKKHLSKKYGDILLGLPAMISMGMAMETTPEEFILRFKKQRATLRVPHEGETKPVAATRTTYPSHWIEESQEDPGATVHPTRAQWEEKLQHVDGELKENLLDLLMEFAAQFWVSGYLPPIRNCRYTIDYRGPPFREPLIPLTKEDVAYVNDYFDDQSSRVLSLKSRKTLTGSHMYRICSSNMRRMGRSGRASTTGS